MATQRPGGVVLIAVLAWIGAVAQILSGILVLTGVLSAPGITRTAAWIAVFVGVISFLVAFYLFSGSRLARILVTISFVLSFLTAVFAIAAHPGNWVGPLVSGLVAVVGIGLLYTQRANAYFSK